MTLQGVSRSAMRFGCLGLVASLLLSMVVTNPTSLGPAGVTLWFVWFGIVVSCCLALINYELVMRYGREGTKVMQAKVVAGCIRHGLLLGGAMAILLALSSLQQLDIRDVGLVLAFVVLVEFYLRTRR